ncbi:hypothetical protein C5167_031016 [Papaver somniferum]|nr:hypothetical protein C5167_031016 [Papaver somniferum]
MVHFSRAADICSLCRFNPCPGYSANANKHVDRREENQTAWRQTEIETLEGQIPTLRALAWWRFQANLLASGGGATDGRIKFWNTCTGACLKSANTGSQLFIFLVEVE